MSLDIATYTMDVVLILTSVNDRARCEGSWRSSRAPRRRTADRAFPAPQQGGEARAPASLDGRGTPPEASHEAPAPAMPPSVGDSAEARRAHVATVLGAELIKEVIKERKYCLTRVGEDPAAPADCLRSGYNNTAICKCCLDHSPPGTSALASYFHGICAKPLAVYVKELENTP